MRDALGIVLRLLREKALRSTQTAQQGSFQQPLVSTLAGGKQGGGTQLTALGEQVLQRYRHLCAQALAAVQDGFAGLGDLLATPASSTP